MVKLKKFLREHWLKTAFLLLGVLLGWFIFSFISLLPNKEQFSQTRFKGNYEFINPLVECDDNSQNVLKKYIPFETETKNKIEEEIIAKNPAVEISYYFRNLNNGPWFGIKEDEKFAPASLLKVPIMIAFLKESESNPSILNKTVLYKKSAEGELVSQNTVVNKPLEIGKSYSIKELVEAMIDDSNNEALYLLGDNISKETVDQVYRDLGITVPDIRGPNDYISVKEYASFFRILYNAAYLEKKTSEEALQILSKSEFHDGLEAGIPKGLKIAHKFGERQIVNENGSTLKQLHDCGIIYYEKYPYLLCVMTKGNDTDNLSSIIRDISKIIYSEIFQKYP
jgi:beta-lactamase class A